MANTNADLKVGIVTGVGCWLGEMTVGTVEAHQFRGNKTFWPDPDMPLEKTPPTPALQRSLNQKHFSFGPPKTMHLPMLILVAQSLIDKHILAM